MSRVDETGACPMRRWRTNASGKPRPVRVHQHLSVPGCHAHQIQFTRGRPYEKDGNARLEQKNWTIVRKLLGWDRYDSLEAQQAINGSLSPRTAVDAEPLSTVRETGPQDAGRRPAPPPV
jgi:hypothetical protein